MEKMKEEMADEVVAAKFAAIQNEGGREVIRNVEYCNLDMITRIWEDRKGMRLFIY